jgi:hypothetical protein
MARSKLDRVAKKVGHAVGTLEVAAEAAGKRARQGVVEAAAVIGTSNTGDRSQKRAAPVKKTAKKKLTGVKKVSKATTKKAAEKVAPGIKTTKRRATTAKKKAGATTKKATKAARKTTQTAASAKKVAKKKATAATKTATKTPQKSGTKATNARKRT